MMKFQACARASIFLAALISFQTFGQTSTNKSLTGQWDFNQSNLKATVGADLQYLGDTATNTVFKTVDVNGASGTVMQFPAATPTEGYLMFHGAKPNGGGTNVNVYTLVLDLFWPSDLGSDGTFRALYNSDTNNLQDAIMFVNPDNAIGIGNDYWGEMTADTWFRLALVVDLPSGKITRYLNGQTDPDRGAIVFTDNVVDSRFSLGPALLLFTDPNGDETRPGLVDRIQFYSDALTGDQVAALGTPLGDGGPPPTGDVKIEKIEKVGANVVITVSGGGTMQLEQKAKLSDSAWVPVLTPSTSGSFTVPASYPTAFFRVHRL